MFDEATLKGAKNEKISHGISVLSLTISAAKTILYSLEDDDNISITSNGQLNFINAPDYETKNSYTGVIEAYDSNDSTAQNITIDITNVTEESNPPIIPAIAIVSSSINALVVHRAPQFKILWYLLVGILIITYQIDLKMVMELVKI